MPQIVFTRILLLLYTALVLPSISACNRTTIDDGSDKEIMLAGNQNIATVPGGEDSAILRPEKISDILLPDGYSRVPGKDILFTQYLRNIKIKDDRTVYLFNGQKKYNQEAQFAVLDISVGQKDLQQCADAVMRIRAEYLWENNRKHEIAFHFTSGHLAVWSKYAEGFRPKINGNSVTWEKSASPDSSRNNFDRYLNLVFSYCGTYSLRKEMNIVTDPSDVHPGDVFVQAGNPYGHAVIVMDVAENARGQRIFMIAQSYMPAQDIHVLVNPDNESLSPWYIARKDGQLHTPEWQFRYEDLRRFNN